MTDNIDRIDLENGKYTVVIDGGHLQILRGGEPWVGEQKGGFIASKAWMVAAYELQELRDKVAKLQAVPRVISYDDLERARLAFAEAWSFADMAPLQPTGFRSEQGLRAALRTLGIEVRS